MITQVGGSVSITRRVLLSWPFVSSLTPRPPTQRGSTERHLITEAECEDGLSAPLTIGMARVIVRPGAVTGTTTPGGVRMIVVESGTLAVGAISPSRPSVSSAELATTVALPDQSDEFLLSTGTRMSFVSRRVTSVRNPGQRPAVALDVAVFHQEPRMLLRAFTTSSGVSFQLLASASAALCPEGRLRVALERVRVGAGGEIPGDLRSGLTLGYVEAGTLSLSHVAGEVFAALAAVAAPYSAPGALQPVFPGEQREITAGSTIFLPEGARADAVNKRDRTASVMLLAIRGVV